MLRPGAHGDIAATGRRHWDDITTISRRLLGVAAPPKPLETGSRNAHEDFAPYQARSSG